MTMPDLCWEIDESACSGWSDYAPDVQERSAALAVSTLRALSGYRVGGCPITVRPCRQSCAQPRLTTGYLGDGTGYYPVINVNGQWVNMVCGCAPQDCSCTVVCEVVLPPPVGEIEAVQVGTEVLPSTWYRVDGGNRLTWQGPDDMDCGWPLCQDMSKPVGEDDTFAVTYLNALPVDALASYVAGVLACEYAKASSGAKCRLPSGVTAVVRQGVAYSMSSNTFPANRTGIVEVDAWLRTVNPNGYQAESRVWSPDLNLPRVTTWSSQ